MKKICCLLFLSAVIYLSSSAQTNPTPQLLPYSENFNSLLSASTIYPTGWQGWTVTTAPGSVFNASSPTADRTLTASGTAASTTGNVYNYDTKIGFLNTGSLDLSLTLALNTAGQTGIQVNYDIMTIRNPYDGGSNTRINEVTLQFRVGTSGTFTTLAGIEYQNNTTPQTSGTAPQNSQTKSVTLPSACDDKPVVQIRWISRQVSGAGSRPSFAVDNINISGGASPTLSISAGSNAAEPSANGSFSINFSSPTAGPTTFDYSLAGSAVLSSDYTVTLSTGSPSPITSTTGTITVPAGITSVTANVIPVNDDVAEPTKTISLSISNPSSGYVLGTSDVSINLTDEDIEPISLVGSYLQNFNSLATTGTANMMTLPGWTINETGGGARDNELYAADDGGSTTGDTYSYGNNSDRALGSLLSGSLISNFGAYFKNNSGTNITALLVNYTGEE